MSHSALRRAIPRIIGETPFGVCQFLRDSLLNRRTEALAFNGQPGRRQMFNDLVRAMTFCRILETGTFRGDTTAFMARRSGLPVFTCESSPRHYGYARARFVFDGGIQVTHGDSRRFLRSHLASEGFASRPLFAYLDAHWGPELPLYDETRILLELSSPIVIMIDDFAVPDDPGYGFDSYGPGATLDLAYLRLHELPDVGAWFPSLRSTEEGGARRGCVLLSNKGPAVPILDSLPSLRPWTVH